MWKYIILLYQQGYYGIMYWYRKHYFEADIFTLNNEPKTFKLTTSSEYKDNSKLKLQKKHIFHAWIPVTWAPLSTSALACINVFFSELFKCCCWKYKS